MSATDFRSQVLASMSEKDWQAQVIHFAKVRGWNPYFTWRSDHSPKGWPDLSMVRVLPAGDRRIVFAELKSMKGKLSAAQHECLDLLSQVAAVARGCIEVHVWKPCDWDEVRERLM